MYSGWAFWKPYIGQAVGAELDLMVLIGGAEKQSTIKSNSALTAHI
jgi:hypothetical protein